MGLLDFMTMKFKHWSYTQDTDLELYPEGTIVTVSPATSIEMREL